jgi:hypothetical protein
MRNRGERSALAALLETTVTQTGRTPNKLTTIGLPPDFLERPVSLLGVPARPFAGVGAGEDFDFAAPVIVNPLDAPISGVLPILARPLREKLSPSASRRPLPQPSATIRKLMTARSPLSLLEAAPGPLPKLVGPVKPV